MDYIILEKQKLQKEMEGKHNESSENCIDCGRKGFLCSEWPIIIFLLFPASAKEDAGEQHYAEFQRGYSSRGDSERTSVYRWMGSCSNGKRRFVNVSRNVCWAGRRSRPKVEMWLEARLATVIFKSGKRLRLKCDVRVCFKTLPNYDNENDVWW